MFITRHIILVSDTQSLLTTYYYAIRDVYLDRLDFLRFSRQKGLIPNLPFTPLDANVLRSRGLADHVLPHHQLMTPVQYISQMPGQYWHQFITIWIKRCPGFCQFSCQW